MQGLRLGALAGALLFIPGMLLAQSTLNVTVPGGDTMTLSTDDLMAMDQVEVKTDNPFVDQVTTFKGPLMRSLLGDAKLDPEARIKVTALDDYSTHIPVSEVLDYDVIIAVSIDGTSLEDEPQGPYWVIYPMTDHAELQDKKFEGRLIWSLADVQLLSAGE